MAHVLVVDDERSTLEALSTILGVRGMRCTTAASGEEALADLEDRRIWTCYSAM